MNKRIAKKNLKKAFKEMESRIVYKIAYSCKI